MKLYVDTNVYLDFFLERSKSRYAERIFMHTVCCKHQIILSDHVVSELIKNISIEKINALFETLKPKLIKIRSEDEDYIYARTLTTHYADAVHIALAKKAQADAIITSNIKDFESIFKTYCPEDI
jgi:predicted nucleic acid-binding protein